MDIKDISCEELFEQYKKMRLYSSYVTCIDISNKSTTTGGSSLTNENNINCSFTTILPKYNKAFGCEDKQNILEHYTTRHKLNAHEIKKVKKTYYDVNGTCFELNFTDYIVK